MRTVEAAVLDGKRSLRTKWIGEEERSLICTPLIGKSREQIQAELECIVDKGPDAIEWRADYFKNIARPDDVVDMANQIKAAVGAATVIFTCRAQHEGGMRTALTPAGYVAVNEAICAYSGVDYIDYELSNPLRDLLRLRDAAHRKNKKIIASFHDFECTPSFDALYEKFLQAERYGLDVAKIAVMPRRMEDVLTLLSVTLAAKKKLSIPLITMSMGSYGVISRIANAAFGSSLSFAVGQNCSAPGQVDEYHLNHIQYEIAACDEMPEAAVRQMLFAVPIEDLKTVFDIIEKSQR